MIMKELSIEEKAKFYDEAIKKAKDALNDGTINSTTIAYLQDIFPELKESEDEQHRKWILEYLYDGLRKSDEQFKGQFKATIAWLEKQYEQHTQGKESITEEAKYNSFVDIAESIRTSRIGTLNNLLSYLKYERKATQEEIKISFIPCIEKLLEELEQKPTDKFEPKFHEGNFVVDNCGYVWKIKGILNQFYVLEDVEGGESRPTIEWVDKTFHLWTIQDAKDGDVLVTGNKNIFIFKSIDNCTVYDHCGLYFGKIKEDSTPVNGWGAEQLPTDYHPATKEQRHLIFQKMKEAGYEWYIEY